MMDTTKHEYWTVDEVAEELRVNPKVIRALLRAGDIRGLKIGKEWRIPAQALAEYLERAGHHWKDPR